MFLVFRLRIALELTVTLSSLLLSGRQPLFWLSPPTVDGVGAGPGFLSKACPGSDTRNPPPCPWGMGAVMAIAGGISVDGVMEQYGCIVLNPACSQTPPEAGTTPRPVDPWWLFAPGGGDRGGSPSPRKGIPVRPLSSPPPRPRMRYLPVGPRETTRAVSSPVSVPGEFSGSFQIPPAVLLMPSWSRSDAGVLSGKAGPARPSKGIYGISE